MKKIYFIFLIMVQAGLALADFNPNNFQIRLVEPGPPTADGLFRVQMRCITSGPLPTTDNVCSDVSFAIWWDPAADPSIIDIDVDNTEFFGLNLNEAAPIPGNSSGMGSPNGTIVNISLIDPFQFPTNWVIDQWVNIINIKICSSANCASGGPPPGITAADFLIQGFTGFLPNFQIDANGVDFTPGLQALPLNLISFRAAKSGTTDAYLTWTTANEENTSHFVVQRSFDKINWTNIGTVGAAGYSIDIRNYELYDLGVNGSLQNRLQVYYRLQMFDLDGKNSLSPIQSVIFYNTILAKDNEFLVYPNPASDGVHVEWSVDNLDLPTSLEFYDIAGKLVYTKKVSEESFQEYVDFRYADMQSGLYMLRIMNGKVPIEHQQIVVGQNR